MKNFCILNGELENIDKLHICPPFVHTESIRQTIRLYDTVALCLAQHLQRMQTVADYLNIQLPENFDTEHVRRYIYRLLNVNKVYLAGCCELIIFWYAGTNTTQFAILIQPIEPREYQFNNVGLKIGICGNIRIDEPYFPCSYSKHSLHEDLLRIHSIESTDAMCYLDEKKEILTTSKGNVVYIEDDTLHVTINEFTEPFSLGFFEHIKRNGWKIEEHTTIQKEHLFNCKELFLVGQFIGLQWICRTTDENGKASSFSYKQAKNLFFELQKFVAMRG